MLLLLYVQSQVPLVLDGGGGDFPAATCVSDPAATTIAGSPIVAQCCDPGST